MAARGYRVHVLTSAATRRAAARHGFDVLSYRRDVDPDEGIPFEAQADAIIAIVAGSAIATDVHDAILATRPGWSWSVACCRRR